MGLVKFLFKLYGDTHKTNLISDSTECDQLGEDNSEFLAMKWL